MARSRSLIIAAIIVGLALLVCAVLYWVDPAKSLPSFFPGHDAASTHHHFKHGVAAFLLGVAAFVLAWFQSGPRQTASAG